MVKEKHILHYSRSAKAESYERMAQSYERFAQEERGRMIDSGRLQAGLLAFAVFVSFFSVFATEYLISRGVGGRLEMAVLPVGLGVLGLVVVMVVSDMVVAHNKALQERADRYYRFARAARALATERG